MFTRILNLPLHACQGCWQLSGEAFLVSRHAAFSWIVRRKLKRIMAVSQGCVLDCIIYTLYRSPAVPQRSYVFSFLANFASCLPAECPGSVRVSVTV